MKKKKKIIDNNKLIEYIKIIETENKLIKKQVTAIEKEKDKMRKEIETLIDKSGSTINYNMQQNIYINNYGNENLNYLSKNYLNNLLKIPYNSIQKLIKQIHFNPKHPENHNIKIPNKKQKFVVVYENGDWKFRNKYDVIENIVDNGYNMLENHFECNNTILEKNKKKNFNYFLYDYDSNKKIKKNIEKQVEIDLLNFNPN